MNTYRFEELGAKDISSMCTLLIERQVKESENFPFLDTGCLGVEHVREVLRKAFDENEVVGVAAYLGDELTGYMMGFDKTDMMRGRHVWVPYEGTAIRGDQDINLIRHLYFHASDSWTRLGILNHYALVPTGSSVYVDSFLGLSFFIQQVHGAMNLDDFKPFDVVNDVSVRVADSTDSDNFHDMATIIASYQNKAPVFAPVYPDYIRAIKEGYSELPSDEDAIVLVAQKDEKILGFQGYFPMPLGLMSPDKCIELSVAGTCPEHMGSGIGRKLMNEGMKMVKEKGYAYLASDWRMANLSSSTFWTKCGLIPVAYRMVRNIEPDWLWANFDNEEIKAIR